MKIYDCFTFFNEFDLLELRLRELYDHVDYFVLVEATKTFQNNDKELHFWENKDRFLPWLDKIVHVPVYDMPVNTDTWGRERFQRDAIKGGMVGANPDDIIMIGDVDEIPRIETIEKLRASTQSIWGFRMPLFNFKFNYMMYTQDYYTVWSGAIRLSWLNSPEDFRRMRHVLNQCPYNFSDDNVQIIEHAGWHFTYLGDEQFIQKKLQSYAHKEANTPDIIEQLNVNESIKNGVGVIRDNKQNLFVLVALDDYFPNTLLTNKTLYNDKIIDQENLPSARQYLPAML